MVSTINTKLEHLHKQVRIFACHFFFIHQDCVCEKGKTAFAGRPESFLFAHAVRYLFIGHVIVSPGFVRLYEEIIHEL